METNGPGRIYLLGSAGSGKGVVGEALAKALGARFVAPNASSEAFVRDPSRAERELLRYSTQVLAPPTEGALLEVVELPPSALLEPAVRSLLAEARERGDVAVLLDAPPDVLLRRAGLTASQMGYLGTPRAWFRLLHSELLESYKGMFDCEADTTNLDPSRVGEEVIAACGLN